MSSNASNQSESRPIFIIGAPRSGTSVMTWAVGQHANIQPMPETAWIAAATVGTYQAHASGSDRGKLSHLSNVNFGLDRFFEIFGRSLETVVHEAFEARCRETYGDALAPVESQLNKHELHIRRNASDPKQRWVDGTPLNTFYTWALAQMFPNAQFLHHIRPPHAVVASLEKFDRVGATPMDRVNALKTWMLHTEMSWATERALGSHRVFRIDFRRIEADAAGLMNDVFAFLGEAPSDDSLEPLSQRLNSSQTHAKADAIIEELAEIELYEEARTLYDTIIAAPQDLPGGDPEAIAFTEDKFKLLSEGRTLIGG